MPRQHYSDWHVLRVYTCNYPASTIPSCKVWPCSCVLHSFSSAVFVHWGILLFSPLLCVCPPHLLFLPLSPARREADISGKSYPRLRGPRSRGRPEEESGLRGRGLLYVGKGQDRRPPRRPQNFFRGSECIPGTLRHGRSGGGPGKITTTTTEVLFCEGN